MEWQAQSGWRWRWLAPLVLALQVLAACTGQGASITPTTGAASPVATTSAASPAIASTTSPSATAASASPIASPTKQLGTPASAAASSPMQSSPPTPSSSAGSPSSDADSGKDQGATTGRKNYVIVKNTQDNNLEVRGNVQLNRIPGKTATPENLAYAYSSCIDCQTFAVALQVNLISKTATVIAPQNVALAINERCTRCKTVARAIQYNVQVDDPKEEPEDVKGLLREMDKTLNEISRDKRLTADQAEQRINAVIAQFQTLSTSLYDRRDEDDGDNGKPTPSPVATLTPTPSPSAPIRPTSTLVPSSGSTPTPARNAPTTSPTNAP